MLLVTAGCAAVAPTSTIWSTGPTAISPAAAAIGPDVPVSGPARVVDGDTLVVDTVRVRLEGIDAPETGQHCSRVDGTSWECGEAATRELGRMIAGSEVTCTPRGRDRYGRMLGHCIANGLDLNREMVRRGLAWAFVKYSQAYVATEAEASRRHIGIWQGASMTAWTWRAERWQAAAAAAPGGCAIKGNVGRAGRIYHLPWSPWYGLVRMDKGGGVRWFCSEDEALAAGWRPAMQVIR